MACQWKRLLVFAVLCLLGWSLIIFFAETNSLQNTDQRIFFLSFLIISLPFVTVGYFFLDRSLRAILEPHIYQRINLLPLLMFWVLCLFLYKSIGITAFTLYATMKGL